jgi:hypothetical protein
MVNYNAGVGDGAVLGDAPDFIMGEKKDSGSGNSDTFFSLHQPMKFLGCCRYPKWFEDWIVHELGVLCDGLFGHWVDDMIAHFLGVDTVENTIRRLGEGLQDCICRGCIECKVDDMVEGLA